MSLTLSSAELISERVYECFAVKINFWMAVHAFEMNFAA
jgi:hypothetical protein